MVKTLYIVLIKQANILKIRNYETKKSELDVDFIGGFGSLTKEEEKTISDFIKASKMRKQKKKLRKTRILSVEK